METNLENQIVIMGLNYQILPKFAIEINQEIFPRLVEEVCTQNAHYMSLYIIIYLSASLSKMDPTCPHFTVVHAMLLFYVHSLCQVFFDFIFLASKDRNVNFNIVPVVHSIVLVYMPFCDIVAFIYV